MNSFDIFVLIAVVIIIVVIVLINMNSILDKRLSNVAVNIPPINIPNPQVIVKVQKSCDSNEYDVFVDNENIGQTKQTVSLTPKTDIEHFMTKEQMMNSFQETKNTVTDVAKVATTKGKQFIDLHKKSKQEQQEKHKRVQTHKPVRQTISPPETNDNTPISHIKFPDDDQLVEYGDYMCVQKNSPEGKKRLAEQKICENQSLIDKKNDAYKYMIKNECGANNHTFPNCGIKEKNNINGSDIEPLEHYRKYQHFIKAYLDDPVMRSYNIDQYQEVSPLFTTGKIPLNDGVPNPKPMGHIFESSPTYSA